MVPHECSMQAIKMVPSYLQQCTWGCPLYTIIFCMKNLRDQVSKYETPMWLWDSHSCHWWHYEIKHIQKSLHFLILRSCYKELKIIYSSEHLKINVLNICQKSVKTVFLNQSCVLWTHHQHTALFFFSE